MAFEETAEDLAQNIRSLGIDLGDLIQRKKIVVDFVRIERSDVRFFPGCTKEVSVRRVLPKTSKNSFQNVCRPVYSEVPVVRWQLNRWFVLRRHCYI
jgi:KaiC/GvpD/RAD55 family RecA-like ATPase